MRDRPWQACFSSVAYWPNPTGMRLHAIVARSLKVAMLRTLQVYPRLDAAQWERGGALKIAGRLALALEKSRSDPRLPGKQMAAPLSAETIAIVKSRAREWAAN